MRMICRMLVLAIVACAFAPPAGAFVEVSGSPFAAGSEPLSVAFGLGGRLLATANGLGDNVSVFSVNQRTGVLSMVPGSPFATGRFPVSVAFSPDGRLLAAVNQSQL